MSLRMKMDETSAKLAEVPTDHFETIREFSEKW